MSLILNTQALTINQLKYMNIVRNCLGEHGLHTYIGLKVDIKLRRR